MKTKEKIKNVAIFSGGILTTKVSAYVFDYAMYPFAIYLCGFWVGFIVMFFASLLLNFLLIKLYDWTKKDVFGFEFLKDIKDNPGGHKFIRKIISLGKIPAFIILSIYDPFLATIFVRKSKKFDGMTKTDWQNLLISGFIGNIAWSLIIELIFHVV
ncbi:MAG: hypothetical protein WCO58_01000 [bacterium]